MKSSPLPLTSAPSVAPRHSSHALSVAGCAALALTLGGSSARAQTQREVRPGWGFGNGPKAPRPEAIRDVILSNLAEVEQCHTSALQRSPRIAGDLVLRFVLLPSGRVRSAIAVQRRGVSPSLGNCIAAAVRRWRFPSSELITTVNYPFHLRSP